MHDASRNLITESQAAELLCVKPTTLRHWRSAGDGPPYHRLGRIIRYRLSTLLQWIDDHEETDFTRRG